MNTAGTCPCHPRIFEYHEISSACQKSLAEFRVRRRESNTIRFLPRHVRGGKHFARSERRIVRCQRTTEAQNAAKISRKSGKATFPTVSLFILYVHAYAVDLHAAVGGDEDVLSPVYHARFYQIAALRRDGYLYFRRLYAELFRVDYVVRVEGRPVAEFLLALALKAGYLFLVKPAALQHRAHLVYRQLQLLRLL